VGAYFLAVLMMLLLPVGSPAADDGATRLHDQTFNTDQTWGGEVVIDGIVQFSPEARLTILPGTVVRFSKTDTDGDGIGENELYVQGGLIARGTMEKPIVFTSAEVKKAPGDWGAINIMVSEGKLNELLNCVIEYSYRGLHSHFSKVMIDGCRFHYNYMAVQCQDSEMTITGSELTRNRSAVVFKDSKLKILNNTISDNYWGVRFLYGEAEIAGNTITGNLTNGVTFRENKVRATGNVLRDNRKGFSSEQAEVELVGNTVDGNIESGVYLKHSHGNVTGNELSGNGNAGVSIEDSDVRVAGNNIVGNAKFGVDNNGTMDVVAPDNWWGTAELAKVYAMVYGKANDPKLGSVDVTPLAPKPHAVK